MDAKNCTVCGISKPISDFYIKSAKCILCEKERRKNINRKPIKEGKLKCSICNEEKELTEFWKNKKALTGFSCSCKRCVRKRRVEIRETLKIENPEEYGKRRNSWRESVRKSGTPERRKAWRDKKRMDEPDYFSNEMKEWRRNNPEKKRVYQREWQRKMMNDPLYRLGQNLRSRLRGAIKKSFGKKNSRSMDLTGCSLEFLTQYLEKQFQPGMSWNNYGKWEIEHTLACCQFDLRSEEEQRKCFHYTNLAPMWAVDNARKAIEDRKKSIWGKIKEEELNKLLNQPLPDSLTLV